MLRTALVLTLALVACQAPQPALKVAQNPDLLHTKISLSFFGDPADSVYNDIFAQLGELEPLVSDYRADSEVSHVSDAAGVKPVFVSPATLIIVKKALAEAQLTQGIFDPTIGPITHLWNIGAPEFAVPDAAHIAAAKTLVNWKDVVVDDAAGTVFLKRKGMILDLGGVTKGYALDLALATARKAGISAGILSMGDSTIGLLGKKPGDKPWKIGLQDPFQSPGAYFGVVEGTDMTVETSGTYQKFSQAGGQRYHHIMDPRTGAPAATGLEQVSLILPLDTTLGDGLSTSCLILGLQKGMELIESLPDAAAVFVGSDHRVFLSKRVADRFKLTDTAFTVGQYPPSP